MAHALTTGLFTKAFNSILTVSKTAIVAWDAQTGASEQAGLLFLGQPATLLSDSLRNSRPRLVKVPSQVLFDRDDAEVTAAGLDKSARKALIGDSRGRVRLVNASTGDCILDTQPHASPVTNVLAFNDNAFVSASSDGLVLVHEEGSGRHASPLLLSENSAESCL